MGCVGLVRLVEENLGRWCGSCDCGREEVLEAGEGGPEAVSEEGSPTSESWTWI